MHSLLSPPPCPTRAAPARKGRFRGRWSRRRGNLRPPDRLRAVLGQPRSPTGQPHGNFGESRRGRIRSIGASTESPPRVSPGKPSRAFHLPVGPGLSPHCGRCRGSVLSLRWPGFPPTTGTHPERVCSAVLPRTVPARDFAAAPGRWGCLSCGSTHERLQRCTCRAVPSAPVARDQRQSVQSAAWTPSLDLSWTARWGPSATRCRVMVARATGPGRSRPDGESANLHCHPLVTPAGPGTRGGRSHNPSPAAMSQNTGGTPVIRLRPLAVRRVHDTGGPH